MGIGGLSLTRAALALLLPFALTPMPAATAATAAVTVTATVAAVVAVEAEPLAAGVTLVTVRTNSDGVIVAPESGVPVPVPKGESSHAVRGPWTVMGRQPIPLVREAGVEPARASRPTGTSSLRVCHSTTPAWVPPEGCRPLVAGHAFGVPGRTRTCDTLLRRQVLYPLSYGDVW